MVLVVTAQIYANADPASIPRMQAKFAEASRTYLKDPGTLSWYVMQDQQDLRSFLIFEKYTDDEVRRRVPSNGSGHANLVETGENRRSRRTGAIHMQRPCLPTSGPCWRSQWP